MIPTEIDDILRRTLDDSRLVGAFGEAFERRWREFA